MSDTGTDAIGGAKVMLESADNTGFGGVAGGDLTFSVGDVDTPVTIVPGSSAKAAATAISAADGFSATASTSATSSATLGAVTTPGTIFLS